MLTRTTATATAAAATAFPGRKRRLPRARYCEGVGDGDKAFSPAFPGVPLSLSLSLLFLPLPPRSPSSRAHAFTPSPLDDLPLSSCCPAATMRLLSLSLSLSLHLDSLAPHPLPPPPPPPPAPLPSSRGGRRTARCPGRSEQLSPALSTLAQRLRVPGMFPSLTSACSPSASLTIRPADALSVSFSPLAVHAAPPSSPFSPLTTLFSASARLLFRLLPAFLLYPSFLLGGRAAFIGRVLFLSLVLSRRTMHAPRAEASLSLRPPSPRPSTKFFGRNSYDGSNLNACGTRKRVTVPSPSKRNAAKRNETVFAERKQFSLATCFFFV
ncbi:transforming growth factor-beta receptor type 3-like protein [Solenopsis invicta]|uniref:transforming growth factor-beta receptor type 3-like protein n=1 Tax=Solenopsis invicta TaxID=13686 RepID=UPI00193E7C52|nr:transforming growth factor-beta receptor type 3-like protein [Solenopsis invicta]XP_039304791.1 transforming growth factor-beta receptor type 3-like protein [Solenopsis invicta]XP_039304792.1 transforming growth factor-beta receptor type 3-like protein [Solenopsis invicta]